MRDIRQAAQVLGYVEYVGSAAGAFTEDIFSVAQVLGYVEYSDSNPPMLGRTLGPAAQVI